jgi:hypothetical protein
MPFKSEAQRGFLYANKPAVAKKFSKDSSTSSRTKRGNALPSKVAKPIKGRVKKK